MEHALDLEHVPGASVSASLDDKCHIFLELLVLDDLARHNYGICEILLAKEEKPEAESEDGGER